MERKTKDQQQHNILYSFTEYRQRGYEQFVDEHSLGYILDGEVHLYTNEGVRVFEKGSIGLIRQNQFARSVKVPPKDGGHFWAINILLSKDVLKKYASERDISMNHKYEKNLVDLSENDFIRAYFHSLLPYYERPDMLTEELALLKTQEAVNLLLSHDASLGNLLFDFSTPYKIDLEAFMNKNFKYHVPINQFAQMTGRSLATFKRDFKTTFNIPPEKWLRGKRLEYAHFLLSRHGLNPGNACYESGFENLSHFSTCFKDHFGYPPSSTIDKTS